jgi:flavodoxin
MKALVIYDTKHGNTERIAEAIGEAIGAEVRRQGEVDPAALQDFDLVIVGSPTHGGWPMEGIHDLLEKELPLGGIDVAAFDTRTSTIWNRLLPFGYAAPRIAEQLGRKGGHMAAPPEGFVVLGMQGPLKEGECERAAAWAKGIMIR